MEGVEYYRESERGEHIIQTPAVGTYFHWKSDPSARVTQRTGCARVYEADVQCVDQCVRVCALGQDGESKEF